MSGTDKFTLYVYDGDYGLPSLDIECTQSILYSAVAKIPVQVKLLSDLKTCMFYGGPTFVHKNLYFKSFNDMILYLRTLHINLDANLNAKQKSEALALTTLVQTKLKTVLEYLLWVDQRNCEEFTKVWYMKVLPMPVNYVRTSRFRNNAMNLIEGRFPEDYNLELVKNCVVTLANECLSSLATRLGTSEYFYGNAPTSLDVILYSYIAPLAKLPFPSNDISNIITTLPNLLSFIKRIDAKYFPDIPKQSKYLKNQEKNKTSDEDVSYVAISILTLSAMSLVIGFAVTRGFISSRYFYR
ncbi:metaxin-1 [Cylas formicarius]|uniref:metaxin-1 n=1 Tax=Cylas formicarius TaxID=197179 RepID=UPI0029583C84|nr:metaxin-1 [Cylas formicarius]